MASEMSCTLKSFHVKKYQNLCPFELNVVNVTSVVNSKYGWLVKCRVFSSFLPDKISELASISLRVVNVTSLVIVAAG